MLIRLNNSGTKEPLSRPRKVKGHLQSSTIDIPLRKINPLTANMPRLSVSILVRLGLVQFLGKGKGLPQGIPRWFLVSLCAPGPSAILGVLL